MSFRLIKKKVLWALSSFLNCCAEIWTGCGLKIDFSKGRSSQTLTGFLNENRIHGTLKAYDFNSIHMLLLFLNGPFDGLCGLTKTDETTRASTAYVDMINFLFRRHMSSEWFAVHTASSDLLSDYKKSQSSFRKVSTIGNTYSEIDCVWPSFWTAHTHRWEWVSARWSVRSVLETI